VTAAELDQARSQVAVAQAQLRAGEFAVQQAEASLAEARDGLAKCTLYAPAAGLVTRLNIQAGETAVVGSTNNPGSLLLTIADPKEMEARIRVDETDVPSIQVGDRATVRIDAFPRQAFPGRVVRVANSASRGSGAQSAHFQVVIALDHTDVPLHPELSANADVVTEERRQVLAIPILALTARDRAGHRPDAAGAAGDGGPMVEGVFVVEDGVARWNPVRVGIVGKTYFEVVGGLQGGETVVSGSYPLVRALEDGDDVEVAPARPTAGVPPTQG
jgi:HlyD family secretion protein